MEKKQSPKKKLGRGMDALLGTYTTPETSDTAVKLLPVSNIVVNPDQPRKEFPEKALKELAESIKEHGIIQPILVQKQGQEHQIIAGERRFRAAQIAGLEEVPAIIRNLDKETTSIISLIENIQRQDLNPIEEAMAFKKLLSEDGMSQEFLSKHLGIARTTIANSVRLLRLPPRIQEAVAKGTLSAGHARAILSVQKIVLYERLFQEAVENGWSVRILEQVAGRLNQGGSIETAIGDVLGSKEPTGAEIQAIPKKKDPTNSARKIPPADNTDAELRVAEKELITALGTKVRILGNHKTGKIEIHYFSLEDLEALLKLLNSSA